MVERLGVLCAPVAALPGDLGRYSPQIAAMRVLRRCRVLGAVNAHHGISRLPAFQLHRAANDEDDPLFYLSHRHYLARGLSSRARSQAAACHYEHESRAFDAAYVDAVYRGPGLTLWRDVVGGVEYDIRLMPGNDICYEGGASIVLHVDGGRVAVLSYSVVPERLIRPGAGEGTIHFVTRKQLAQNHSYQQKFNKAFDRVMPGHLCFAAFAGLVTALGRDRAFGIAATHHPSWAPEWEAQFARSYCEFWQDMGGRRVSDFGYDIAMPPRLTPLDEIDAARRKRAVARRKHMADVQASAQAVMAPFVVGVRP